MTSHLSEEILGQTGFAQPFGLPKVSTHKRSIPSSGHCGRPESNRLTRLRPKAHAARRQLLWRCTLGFQAQPYTEGRASRHAASACRSLPAVTPGYTAAFPDRAGPGIHGLTLIRQSPHGLLLSNALPPGHTRHRPLLSNTAGLTPARPSGLSHHTAYVRQVSPRLSHQSPRPIFVVTRVRGDPRRHSPHCDGPGSSRQMSILRNSRQFATYLQQLRY